MLDIDPSVYGPLHPFCRVRDDWANGRLLLWERGLAKEALLRADGWPLVLAWPGGLRLESFGAHERVDAEVIVGQLERGARHFPELARCDLRVDHDFECSDLLARLSTAFPAAVVERWS